MLQINSSDFYEYIDDLWLVTCYFNPRRYKTKFTNYMEFRRRINNSGLRLLTIECAFGNDDFTLEASQDVLQIRSPSVMWQKERLLNIAIKNLPKDADKISWLDCDILFSNANWAVETSKLLDHFPIVQPYRRAFRLPKNHTFYNGIAESCRSFGYVLGMNYDLFPKGNFQQHGHTGFAWAGRRDFLEKYGLYDALISGSADHMMAHAMCGDFSSSCIKRIMGGNQKLLSRFGLKTEVIRGKIL